MSQYIFGIYRIWMALASSPAERTHTNTHDHSYTHVIFQSHTFTVASVAACLCSFLHFDSRNSKTSMAWRMCTYALCVFSPSLLPAKIEATPSSLCICASTEQTFHWHTHTLTDTGTKAEKQGAASTAAGEHRLFFYWCALDTKLQLVYSHPGRAASRQCHCIVISVLKRHTQHGGIEKRREKKHKNRSQCAN